MYSRGAYSSSSSSSNAAQHRPSLNQWDSVQSSTPSAHNFTHPSYSEHAIYRSNEAPSSSSVNPSTSQYHGYSNHQYTSQRLQSAASGFSDSFASSSTRGQIDFGFQASLQSSENRNTAYLPHLSHHRISASSYNSYASSPSQSQLQPQSHQADLLRDKTISPLQTHNQSHHAEASHLSTHSQDPQQQKQQRYSRSYDTHVSIPQSSYSSENSSHANAWNSYSNQSSAVQTKSTSRDDFSPSLSNTALYNNPPAQQQPSQTQQPPQHQQHQQHQQQQTQSPTITNSAAAAAAKQPAKRGRKPKPKVNEIQAATGLPSSATDTNSSWNPSAPSAPRFIDPSQTLFQPLYQQSHPHQQAHDQHNRDTQLASSQIPGSAKNPAHGRNTKNGNHPDQSPVAVAPILIVPPHPPASSGQADSDRPKKKPRGRPRKLSPPQHSTPIPPGPSSLAAVLSDPVQNLKPNSAVQTTLNPPPLISPETPTTAPPPPSSSSSSTAPMPPHSRATASASPTVPSSADDKTLKRKRGRPSLPEGPKSRYTAQWRNQFIDKLRELRVFASAIEDEQMQEDFDDLFVQLETMSNGRVMIQGQAADA